jgi:geranylgeranyl pyrophosphate synthase
MLPLREFTAEKSEVRQAVEECLTSAFAAHPKTEVREAAEYAVLGGGHRWRAITTVAAGTIFRADALRIVLPTACSVELAHAASLVLDDLPSMDNADIRRGKPCVHCVFPPWAVDMTPIFLITLAYEITLANPLATAQHRVNGTLELSTAGIKMITGQVGDVRQDQALSEEQRLLDLYTLKSGALYGASGKAGAILCGATGEEAQLIYDACVDMGLSMQFMDDIADVEADIPEVGKRSGMDAGKRTAVDWLGLEGARKRCKEFQDRGRAQLERFGPDADWLRRLVCEVSWKTY